eukprot:3296814-Prymnesium_polylepis.1
MVLLLNDGELGQTRLSVPESSIHMLYNQPLVGGVRPLLTPARQIVNLQLHGRYVIEKIFRFGFGSMEPRGGRCPPRSIA